MHLIMLENEVEIESTNKCIYSYLIHIMHIISNLISSRFILPYGKNTKAKLP